MLSAYGAIFARSTIMTALLSNLRIEQFLANIQTYHLNVKKECLLLEQINARILVSNICVHHSNSTPTLK